jgi:hypothetical protein
MQGAQQLAARLGWRALVPGARRLVWLIVCWGVVCGGKFWEAVSTEQLLLLLLLLLWQGIV